MWQLDTYIQARTQDFWKGGGYMQHGRMSMRTKLVLIPNNARCNETVPIICALWYSYVAVNSADASMKTAR